MVSPRYLKDSTSRASGIRAVTSDDNISHSLAEWFKGYGKTADDEDLDYGGFWPNEQSGARIHRFRDRLFVGFGSESTGDGNGANQAGIFPTSTDGANWATRDATLLSVSDTGLMAVVGIAKASLQTGANQGAIGIAGFAVADYSGRGAWAGYFDMQRESGSAYGMGLEIAVKNKGNNLTETPYSAQGGALGILLQGGGDESSGGVNANPLNYAIKIGKSSTTWNVGIVFESDALTASGGLMNAISMGANQAINFYREVDGAQAGRIYSTITSTNQQRLVFTDNGFEIAGPNQEVIGLFTHNTSAVDYVQIQNGAGAVIVGANGSTTNVDLRLTPKGSGNIRYGTHSAIAAETVTGYITIKDNGGTVRKLAVVS